MFLLKKILFDVDLFFPYFYMESPKDNKQHVQNLHIPMTAAVTAITMEDYPTKTLDNSHTVTKNSRACTAQEGRSHSRAETFLTSQKIPAADDPKEYLSDKHA